MASSPRWLTRVVSLCFTLLLLLGPLSIVYVPSQLASEKLSREHRILFLRIGLFGDLSIILIECVMIPALFLLLAPCSYFVAAAAAVARAAMVMMMCANLFSYAGMLFTDQSDKLLLKVHTLGVQLWEFPFGLHILLIAFLIGSPDRCSFLGNRSCSYLNNLFGGSLLIAAAGYFLDAFAGVACSGEEPACLHGLASTCNGVGGFLSFLGEPPFFVYLMLRGVDEAMWIQQKNDQEHGSHPLAAGE